MHTDSGSEATDGMYDGAIEALLEVPVGGHRHLDEILAKTPGPGSWDWLEVVDGLIPTLRTLGGRWTVTVPVGHVADVPTGLVTPVMLREKVDSSTVLETPAVHRRGDSHDNLEWEGENHRWQRHRSAAVMEVLSINRTATECVAGEPFQVTVLLEVADVGSP